MSVKKLAKMGRDRGNKLLVKLGAVGHLPSAVYYGVGSRRFDREHHGVLVGKNKYLSGSSAFLLRRGTHRLEKGLCMRPRRDIFALNYIEETAQAFVDLHERGNADPKLMHWAGDVLRQYFELSGSAPEIDRARELFESVSRSDEGADEWVPFARGESPPPVSYEDLYALTRRRRSVRWFLQKPVDRGAIDRALEAGAQAPSACNRQPFEFRIYDEPAMVRRVIDLPMGSKGFGHNVPVVAVVVGKLSAFFHERDRHLIYTDSSLAIMGFLLALETQGLASCCLNWPDHEPYETRMAETLGLEADERAIMLIAIGHPDPEGLIPYSAKKSLDRLRSYNQLKG